MEEVTTMAHQVANLVFENPDLGLGNYQGHNDERYELSDVGLYVHGPDLYRSTRSLFWRISSSGLTRIAYVDFRDPGKVEVLVIGRRHLARVRQLAEKIEGKLRARVVLTIQEEPDIPAPRRSLEWLVGYNSTG